MLAEQKDLITKQYMKEIDRLTATVSDLQEKLKMYQCETTTNVEYWQKKTNEIQESLEFSQKDLDMVRISVEECNGLKSYEIEFEELKEQVCYLENQSRRNNVRIDGIPESSEEADWKITEEKVKKQ